MTTRITLVTQLKTRGTYVSTPPCLQHAKSNSIKVSLEILSTVESRVTWCTGYIAWVGIQGLLETPTACWIRAIVQTKQKIIF